MRNEAALEWLTSWGVFVVLCMAAIVLVVRWWKRAEEPGADAADQDPQAKGKGKFVPLCQTCGASATAPSPIIRRGRGGAVLDALGLPAFYRRGVPGPRAPRMYCNSCAHVADACTVEFLAGQRELVTKAFASVARRVATFESEELPRLVGESLTVDQRKAAAKRLAADMRPSVAKPNGASGEAN